MKDRMTSSRRRPARWAILPTIALAALCAGLPAAQARDQQATGAQLDNALNWRAASGTGFSGGYAQAPIPGHVQAYHRSAR